VDAYILFFSTISHLFPPFGTISHRSCFMYFHFGFAAAFPGTVRAFYWRLLKCTAELRSARLPNGVRQYKHTTLSFFKA